MPLPTARNLLGRLVSGQDPDGLSVELIADAEQVFLAAGDRARARWMKLEREGFGSSTDSANLAEVLGSASEPVVAAVLRARTQLGRVRVGGVVRQWPHFFVESVPELQVWARKVGRGGAPTLELEFDSAMGGSPHALTFDRPVFAHVLASIAREIGAALQTVGGSA